MPEVQKEFPSGPAAAKADIRLEITERRRNDIKQRGWSQGLDLPDRRTAPHADFLGKSPVICEIKRKSPSVPEIDTSLDPACLAGRYYSAGITNISVLTEENYFGGSLKDLITVKKSYPDISVLRKDFLVSEEDIDVSFLAGADAFLLIASLLDAPLLEKMYRKGIELGMTPLVELHDYDDVRKASAFKPGLVGINSRNLKNFRIYPVQPLKIRALIDWPCRVIYESGIKTEYNIDFAAGTGFSGVLVGEAAVRDSGFTKKILSGFSRPDSRRFSFWSKLYSRKKINRPLIKYCGFTNRSDLEYAAGLGIDAAGFILAESPRRVSPDFIRTCSDIKVLKIGVVVLEKGEQLPEETAKLLDEGILDAVQFHGNEEPEYYTKLPGYKAVRLRAPEDVYRMKKLEGPAVLIDAFSLKAAGGTGKLINPDLVRMVKENQTLWLAGGVTAGNVKGLINEFSPDLIDVSSGIESAPGKKDHSKMKEFFEAAGSGEGKR